MGLENSGRNVQEQNPVLHGNFGCRQRNNGLSSFSGCSCLLFPFTTNVRLATPKTGHQQRQEKHEKQTGIQLTVFRLGKILRSAGTKFNENVENQLSSVLFRANDEFRAFSLSFVPAQLSVILSVETVN